MAGEAEEDLSTPLRAVLTAIVIGILLGYFNPKLGEQMQPLGQAFINLIKMMIAPIIFCTVVHGIASMSDMKRVGRVGIKALIYFEVMTTLALIIGLIVVNIWQPGAGIDASTADPKAVQSFVAKGKEQSAVQFLMHIGTALPPTAGRRTRSRSASSRGSTTRSASFSGEPMASATKSTFVSKSSHACCRCCDASPLFWGRIHPHDFTKTLIF